MTMLRYGTFLWIICPWLVSPPKNTHAASWEGPTKAVITHEHQQQMSLPCADTYTYTWPWIFAPMQIKQDALGLLPAGSIGLATYKSGSGPIRVT